VGNGNCISFLQFESEVVDRFKDGHKISPGKLKNVASETLHAVLPFDDLG
jgi:hypothetical protein